MRSALAFSVLLAVASHASASQCSVGGGATFTSDGPQGEIANLGCEWRGFEARVYYVGATSRMAPAPSGELIERHLTDAYPALSLMKLFRFDVRGTRVVIGGGVFLKRDDTGIVYADEVDWGAPRPIATFRTNLQVPRPVSFSAMLALERRALRIRYGHVSNGQRSGTPAVPNLGLNFLQVEYRF